MGFNDSQVVRTFGFLGSSDHSGVHTRRDSKQLLAMLRLFLIDEVHMLKEESRGSTLEVVVSRMKTVDRALHQDKSIKIRLLAVSATVPNLADIASWLKNEKGSPAIMKEFGEEYRPVKLIREVIGFPCSGNDYMFDKFLDSKLMDTIRQYSTGKPTLVFCATRKSVVSSAEAIASNCRQSVSRKSPWGRDHPFVKTLNQYEALLSIKSQLTDKKLSDIIEHGVAFHNGALAFSDRRLIEDFFMKSLICVICTTSTLAVGVNLPAHLVIIKSTHQYINGATRDYSELDMMQMLGRAGRPQFDDSGVAVIMTTSDKKARYEDMVCGKETIESGLHRNLLEHLNAEIVLETIGSVSQALDWLKASFLYVRILKNPYYYKLKDDSADNRMSVNQRLEKICTKDLNFLNRNELAILDQETLSVKSTEYGKIMAKYYVKANTIIRIIGMKEHASIRDVLEVLCQAEEYPIKFQSDKAHLNNLNKQPGIRFPIKGRVTSIDQKVSLLIQCALGSVEFSDVRSSVSMSNETTVIFQHCVRVIKSIVDVCVVNKDPFSLRSALDLGKCLQAKTWENSNLLLKQIDGIGPSFARLLSNVGITTFDKITGTDARTIEFTLNRNPPFGNKVLDAVAKFPRFKMAISQVKELSNPTRVELYIQLNLENPNEAKTFGKKGSYAVSFVASTSDHRFITHRRIFLTQLKEGESFRILVNNLTKATQAIQCSLISENFGMICILCGTTISSTLATLVGLDLHEEVIPDIKATHFRSREIADKIDSVAKNFNKLENRQSSALYQTDEELDRLMIAECDLISTAQLQKTKGESNDFKESLKGFEVFDEDWDLDDPFSNTDPPPLPSQLITPVEKNQKPVLVHLKKEKVLQDIVENRIKGTGKTEMVPCNHSCKNKKDCAHLCCKTGVPLKKPKRRIGQASITPASMAASPLVKKFKYASPSSNPILLSPMRASALDPNFFKSRNNLTKKKKKAKKQSMTVLEPFRYPGVVSQEKPLTDLLDIIDSSSSVNESPLRPPTVTLRLLETDPVGFDPADPGSLEQQESLYDEALHDLNDGWESDLIVDVVEHEGEIRKAHLPLSNHQEQEQDELDELEDHDSLESHPQLNQQEEEVTKPRDAIRALFADLF